MATQLNPMIHDGSLSEFSIVKVKKLQCNNMLVCMDEVCTNAIFGNKCLKTVTNLYYVAKEPFQ